jgi:hypothetical protein
LFPNCRTDKIKELEQELRLAKEISQKLRQENDELKKANKGSNRGSSPSLLSPIVEDSYSSKRLTHQNSLSADEKDKLLRELQDTMERESDLREQLQFCESEVRDAALNYRQYFLTALGYFNHDCDSYLKVGNIFNRWMT